MFRFLSVFVLGFFVVGDINAETHVWFRDISGQPNHEEYFSKYIPRHDTPAAGSAFSLAYDITEEEYYNFLLDIKEGNCEDIFKHLELTKPYFFSVSSSLKAYFFEEGICTTVNTVIASEIYLDSLDEFMAPHFATVRLGNLYYLGLGVEQNLEKANFYFKKAAMIQAVYLWDEELVSPNFESDIDIESTEFKISGLTGLQLDKNFTTVEAGPWALPPPLEDQIIWIKSLWTNDGAQIINLAQQIHNGDNNYEKDLLTPVSWMYYLMIFHQNEKAGALFKLWNEELNSEIISDE